MDWVVLILVGLGSLAGLYIAVWIAARAFFDNKVDYNRRLFEQLREKTNAEEDG